MEKRLTRARAVKLHCMGCYGWKENGGQGYTGPNEAIKMVRECDSPDCYLYNFRTGSETTPNRPKRILSARQETAQKNFKALQKKKRI